MNSVIVGMFDSQAAATQARTHLLSAGFSADAVTLAGGGESSTSSYGSAGTTSATTTGSSYSSSSGTTGTGVGDAVSDTAHHAGGAISRFFHNLFGSDDDDADGARAGYTDTYNEAFRRGSYGVSVEVSGDDEMDRAERILNDAGAVDIDEKASSWRKEGWTGGAATATAGAVATGAAATGATQKLQEIEEELKVGKRAVARGGLRVFKRLVETPVEESVRLREEHATIERRTVDRPATEADFSAFKEGSIEVRETGEEAVVSKTARVTGEVEIGKTVTEREEVVRDTLRKTQVDVEEIAGSTRSTTGTSTTTGTTGTGVNTATGTDLGSTSGTRMP